MNSLNDKFFKSLPTLSRNPLGIIALFIALIYAITALVLIFGSDLTSSNRLVLIIFLVTFPFVVLLTFYKLVTKHHVKLYAPVDYRSDESFLSSIDPSETAIRLMKDIEEDTDEDFGHEETHYDVSPKSPNANNQDYQLDTQIKKIALIEDLVLRELETKFNTAFRRQVGFKSSRNDKIMFDAIGVIENEYVAVEIKYLRTKHFPVEKSLNRIIDQANDVVQTLEKAGKNFRLMVVIVTEMPLEDYTDLKITLNEIKNISKAKIKFELFDFKDLKKKYGLN